MVQASPVLSEAKQGWPGLVLGWETTKGHDEEAGPDKSPLSLALKTIQGRHKSDVT